MIVTHKPIKLHTQIATRWTFLWTTRGLQIARKGDWIVSAPTGCVWRIRKKHHKFYDIHPKSPLHNITTEVNTHAIKEESSNR